MRLARSYPHRLRDHATLATLAVMRLEESWARTRSDRDASAFVG
jgi:hypothetical protein